MRPPKAVRCVSPKLTASMQLATAPDGSGVCWSNTRAGPGVGEGEPGGVLERVRLLDSAVNDLSEQPGPVLAPLSTSLRTRRFAPLLNTTWLPPPSPKTLNSACCHWLLRSGKRLSPEAA